ncbi:aldose 1-epimerase family protein [Actinobaculum sp. 313]|uniref:aldose 1-epimerase family protein n=1 Tax=Actinobaculum sp. 313 TaxID=2495645 RepID=UPI000D5271E9|nr:aldose 1-epimerase family protein [Actinobaculum sp. 313]AWE43298.1 aldose epimerase [Actinobaculum sp. 313]
MSGAEAVSNRGNVGSAEEVRIACGDAQALVTPRGAGLRAYRVGSRDVVVTYPGPIPPAMHGAILAPWPNRLADGRYEFGGNEYQLPVTEPARRVANHGFVHDQIWAVTDRSADSVEFRFDIGGELEGYPFPLELRVRYLLDDEDLVVAFTATNCGEVAAPFGVGFHPWLSPGEATVDECELRVAASGWVRANERLLPEEFCALPADKDFRTPRSLRGVSLDDGFAPAVFSGEYTWAELISPDGMTAAVWAEHPLEYWQICTGDFPEIGAFERSGVAAEPMSCPADAFNSGKGLVTLQPGETYSVRWGLCLRRTSDHARSV